jgi:hypothetical protein
VKAAKHPDQKNDWKWNSEEPQQQSASHDVLIRRLMNALTTVRRGNGSRAPFLVRVVWRRTAAILRGSPAWFAGVGEVAEWLKALAWKACIRETVSWVRIPLSPPYLIDYTTLFSDIAGLSTIIPTISFEQTTSHRRIRSSRSVILLVHADCIWRESASGLRFALSPKAQGSR